MENHPIPEDVIGFKFRLIGSITVKQFLYLLASGIFIAITLVLPLFFILKVPLIIVFALLGFSLAFVPIDGRPLDVMIFNFIKTIPSDNKYIYQKRQTSDFQHFYAGQNSQPRMPQAGNFDGAKRDILESVVKKPAFEPDEKEAGFIAKVREFFELSNKYPTPQAARPQNENVTKNKITGNSWQHQEQGKQTNPPIKARLQNDGSHTQAKIQNIETQLNNSSKEKEELERKMINSDVEKVRAASPFLKPKQTDSHNKPGQFQAQNDGFKAGFPTLPEVPNVVLGIVKDPRGKIIPNILVEVIDENNIPVRTFKTNALGQFISATPLPNGSYRVFLEDPQKNHEFETININMDGTIFQPLEIFSVDAREKLRRELFQKNTN